MCVGGGLHEDSMRECVFSLHLVPAESLPLPTEKALWTQYNKYHLNNLILTFH